jgi:hypothetical protein
VRHIDIYTERSAALFVSTLQASDDPGARQLRQVIAQVVRELGSRECAARVAQEFGDHPETAVERMRWARSVVGEVFVGTRKRAASLGPFASLPTARAGHAA